MLKVRTQALEEDSTVLYPEGVRAVRGADRRTCWTSTHRSTTRSVRSVCFDEISGHLTGEVRPPIEASQPDGLARYDTEYQRNGTRNLFGVSCEP